MFGKVFESLYNKVLVNIVVDRLKTTVYIEVCSKTNVIDSVEEVFNTISLTKGMKEFISSYTAESPYFYISILDTSVEQGAIPTCTKNRISHYKDLSSSISKCFNKKWTYYSSQDELYAIERKYENIGIDFIFSPFILLADFFKDKIDTHMALFILIQDTHISLSVFHNSELLYSEHLDLENSIDSDDDMLMYAEEVGDIDIDIDDSIDLDDIDAMDELDSFDDFGDIEDLDSIEDSEDFLETGDAEEEFHQEKEKEEEIPVNEADGFNEDYQRFLLIQSSINRFYKDEKYESEFIQSVYMADGIGVSQDLKRYLEEEMFMDVYSRQVEIAVSLCDMTKMELDI